MREKGLHDSKVRDLIVDAFLSAEEHLGLEAILEKARRKNSGISHATVYRTMRLLVEAGVAHARDFGAGSTVYEVAHGRAHHDHLIRERCGTVVEFVNEQIEQREEHGPTLVDQRIAEAVMGEAQGLALRERAVHRDLVPGAMPAGKGIDMKMTCKCQGSGTERF